MHILIRAECPLSAPLPLSLPLSVLYVVKTEKEEERIVSHY